MYPAGILNVFTLELVFQHDKMAVELLLENILPYHTHTVVNYASGCCSLSYYDYKEYS